MRTYKPKEIVREIVCQKCGDTFTVHDNRVRKLCSKCGRDRGYIRPVVKVKPGRECHDCGKPTTDFRCTRCQEKFRTRNDIPRDFECVEDVFEVMVAC